jgi:hypothetical protein
MSTLTPIKIVSEHTLYDDFNFNYTPISDYGNGSGISVAENITVGKSKKFIDETF